MKGLLMKDFRILLHQKTTFLVIVLLGIFLGTNGGNITFSMGYMMMVSGTLSITTIAYDYFEKGLSFMFVLPVSKKMYVAEKYLFSVLMCLAMAVIGILLNIAGGFFDAQAPWNEFAGTVAVCLGMTMLMLAWYIPVYLKCGPEKSRVAILIVFGSIAVIVYLVAKVEPVQKVLGNVAGMLSGMSALQIVGMATGVWVLFMAVSIVVSINILEKKEF